MAVTLVVGGGWEQSEGRVVWDSLHSSRTSVHYFMENVANKSSVPPVGEVDI